ncbi:DNA cytosine methyltransferase [Candidatus Mycobacterium methanotrophicum]|uniref:DNA cytosine methyltransferase n=1 Tax=Candidatus Mycobacterium methanotrophicum TaxID=2943498 RepID=A0ABY4QHD5_9MYCO|nr:DNA cytosine methyltransferase [Candidatus Mycobacterium methanotrophicum]UQX09949.1 DNA cytosine methyltransferase [Candidatus Mycobacterium methanotrophicum]
MKVGSLFSGAGGLDSAVEKLFGAQTVWQCENDPAAAAVLARRWPEVPNLGDVTAVDWGCVEPVDVLCGGFPCQDVSAVGLRAGMRPGTRSGLWAQFRDAIAEFCQQPWIMRRR